MAPRLHSAAGRARAEAAPGTECPAHAGRMCPLPPRLPAPQMPSCNPRASTPLPPHCPFPQCPCRVQLSTPLPLYPRTPKTGSRQPTAPGRGEGDERRGWQQDPIRPGAIQPGRGTCSWQLSLSPSTMASPPPRQSRHKSHHGVPGNYSPEKARLGVWSGET